MTEQELNEKFERLVGRVLNPLIKNMSNNIRTGTVVSVNTVNRQIEARVAGTKEVLRGITYQKGGNSDTVTVGDPCVLISQDPNLKGQVYAIIF